MPRTKELQEYTMVKVESGKKDNVKKKLDTFKTKNECKTLSQAISLALDIAKRS